MASLRRPHARVDADEEHADAGPQPIAQPQLRPDRLDQLPIRSMRSHSSSVTGITDSRDMRTSGNEANALSAFTAASVTGDFSFFTGTTSTA